MNGAPGKFILRFFRANDDRIDVFVVAITIRETEMLKAI